MNFYWINTGLSTGGKLTFERATTAGAAIITARLTWPWGDTVAGRESFSDCEALRSLDEACCEDCANEMLAKGEA